MNLKEIREKHKHELYIDDKDNLIEDKEINSIQRETALAVIEEIEKWVNFRFNDPFNNFKNINEPIDAYREGALNCLKLIEHKLSELKKEFS